MAKKSKAAKRRAERNERVRAKITSQEVLAQTRRRSSDQVRLSRVTYDGNEKAYIDVRIFNRGFDDDGNEVFYPTRQGVHIEEEQMQRLIGKWTLVPSVILHPEIRKKSLPALEREEFDTSVTRALKAIEVRVRALAKLPADLVGTSLMRKAFNPESGKLSDMAVPVAEREARANLFCGAIGCYKNPHSHRDVEISFQDAFEVLLLASHMMRILDQISASAA